MCYQMLLRGIILGCCMTLLYGMYLLVGPNDLELDFALFSYYCILFYDLCLHSLLPSTLVFSLRRFCWHMIISEEMNERSQSDHHSKAQEMSICTVANDRCTVAMTDVHLLSCANVSLVNMGRWYYIYTVYELHTCVGFPISF